MRQIIFAAIFFLFVSVTERPVVAETVYDSLSDAGGGYGVLDGEVGQSVQLAGTGRQVTKIELFLGASSSVDFRVRFYELNGVRGTPGTMFWESPLQTFTWEPPKFNERFIAIDVPGITVPDKFAWIVKGYDPSNSKNLLVLSSLPPTIGQNYDFWVVDPQNNWVSFHLNTGVVGARINAIPEPASLLLAVGAVIAFAAFRRVPK